MGGLDFIHPELVKRYTRLVAWAWSNSWDIGITSGARSYAQQKAWYDLWIMVPPQWPALVANPDIIPGKSPWGWDVKGSLHEIQYDGFAHALDIFWTGPDTKTVHDKAYQFGLQFVNSSEKWHCQWFDFATGIFPIYEEEDMTVDEFAKATGLVPDPGGSGQLGMMLLETYDPAHPEANTFKWYNLATAIVFVHQEEKMRRLG